MTVLTEPPPSRRRTAVAGQLLRAIRPRQWVKNVLVLSVPSAAGLILNPGVLFSSMLAMLSFTQVACGCYLFNDIQDRALDRAHPHKRTRPVAAGTLPAPVALVAAVLLVVAGLGTAASQRPALLGVLVAYLVLTVAYALGLKGLPWLEIAIVASGFVLRALAGAAATGIPVSAWFMLVVSSAALWVVASKRASEQLEVPDSPHSVRPVLARYRPSQLRLIRAVVGCTVGLAYAAWAWQRPTVAATALAMLSLVPLLTVLLRWARQTERGLTGSPEHVILHDPVVRLGVLAWMVTFGATVLTAVPG